MTYEVMNHVKAYKRTIQKLLHENLIGVYVIGSLALEDYRKSSDVDVLVVIKRELNRNEATKLGEIIHPSIFEISFVTQDMLLNNKGYMNNSWYFNGTLRYEAYGSEWYIDRYILKYYGILIESEIIEINQDIDEVLHASQMYYQRDLCQLISNVNQLSDEYLVFLFLSLCRTIYTLENKHLTSKSRACLWVKEKLALEGVENILR